MFTGGYGVGPGTVELSENLDVGTSWISHLQGTAHSATNTAPLTDGYNPNGCHAIWTH